MSYPNANYRESPFVGKLSSIFAPVSASATKSPGFVEIRTNLLSYRIDTIAPRRMLIFVSLLSIGIDESLLRNRVNALVIRCLGEISISSRDFTFSFLLRAHLRFVLFIEFFSMFCCGSCDNTQARAT